MKNILKSKIAYLLVLVLGFGACTDLSENPYDLITEEQLAANPDFQAALTAPVYTRLTDVLYGWHSFFDLQEECSDAIVTPARPNGWVDGGTYRALHMHTWNAFQSQPRNLWNRAYGALNILNGAILNNQKAGNEGTVAELRALRGLYYYFLLDNFGNVPIVTESDVEAGNRTPEQKTRAEVFAFIESELKTVMPNLSEAKVYGRMNKWAAKMILAKMYLNAQVYLGTPRWNDAITEVDDIIQSGLFQLESSYRNNFITNNEVSTEQIFSVIFDERRAGWFHYHWKTLHPASAATYNLGTAPWGGSCAIPQFIDTYDPDDERLKSWIQGPQFSSSGAPIYNSMDPALKTVQLDYQNTLGSIDGTKEYEGYRVGKYEIKVGTIGPLSNDVPLFRYADALMIKAECLLRTGRADEAAAIVTQVRQRNFPNNPEKAVVTGADLMQGSSYNYGVYKEGQMVNVEGGDDIQYGRFFDELGWEFAGEFHRRQDLIRFGVFTKKSWFSHVPNGEYRTIFPIPQSAIDANAKLQQNPGY